MADLFDVLFNSKKPFVPKRVSGGTTNGRIVPQNVQTVEDHLEASETATFEEDVDIIRRQLNQKLAMTITKPNSAKSDRVSDEVYKKFNFNYRTQDAIQLPVHVYREKILSKIAEYPSLVIQGSTGCGKSTQVSPAIY